MGRLLFDPLTLPFYDSRWHYVRKNPLENGAVWPARVEFDALPHWIELSADDTALTVTHSPNYASKVPWLSSPAWPLNLCPLSIP